MIKEKYNIYVALTLFLILFISIQFNALQLPFYWDEAWVYGPAIQIMHENGPSLSPDVLPIFYSRGHPLLFHFLGGLWLSIWGNNLIAAHSFALFLSIALLLLLFYIIQKILNTRVAFISVCLLVFQPAFLAQSSLVLPEITLALFCLGALHFYLNNNKLIYILFASLAILTKESAIVLFTTLPTFEFIFFISRKTNLKTAFKNSLIALAPSLTFLIFLLIQKETNGWFFFPEHTGFISFDLLVILNKFKRFFSFLSIYQGRNVFFFSILSIIAYGLYFKKLNLRSLDYKNIILYAIFIVEFLLFSAFNFYSDRYVLCLFSPLFIIGITIIEKTDFSNNLKYILYTSFIISGIINVLIINTNADTNLGYRNAVKLNQKIAQTLQEENAEHKNIYASFLIKENLSNKYAKYINKDTPFKQTTCEGNNCDYYIYTNLEGEEGFKQTTKNLNLDTLKNFEIGFAKGLILKKRN